MMREPTDDEITLAKLHEELKQRRRRGPFIDWTEGGMTTWLVPWELVSDMNHRAGSVWSAKDHHAVLRDLRQLFAPIMGRRASISGTIGLPTAAGWTEYTADYAAHGVNGRVTSLDGFVVETSDQRYWYRYCLVIEGGKVGSDDPPINMAPHQTGDSRVLVVIDWLDGSHWGCINRFEPEGERA